MQSWDYSSPSFYYITICVKDNKKCLSKIENEKVCLSMKGVIVDKLWNDIPRWYQNCSLREYVIMPDHLHGIIEIESSKNEKGQFMEGRFGKKGQLMNCPYLRREMLIPKAIGKFKMLSSKNINLIDKEEGRQFWHRSYYCEVFQSKERLKQVEEYIRNNPKVAFNKGDLNKGNS